VRFLPYGDLVRELVRRELRLRYRRSLLGFAWTMLQPLLTMIVLHIAFSAIFRFDVDNYPVFVLSGVLFWSFFSQSITQAMISLRANGTLIQRLPVPKIVFPLAAIASGVINLALALVPLLAILVVTGHPLEPALLFLPVAIAIAALFTLGAGLLLSPLAVFFSDIVEMVGVVLQLAMYLTPVVYPMSIVPERWRGILRFNPLRSILEVFRDPIYYGKIPPVAHIAVAAGVAVVLFLLGLFVFRRSERRIALFL
jgi:ABC-type polysaccharide/polyol phosphate export permease